MLLSPGERVVRVVDLDHDCAVISLGRFDRRTRIVVRDQPPQARPSPCSYRLLHVALGDYQQDARIVMPQDGGSCGSPRTRRAKLLPPSVAVHAAWAEAQAKVANDHARGAVRADVRRVNRASRLDALVEAAVEVARLDRGAVTGREDEPGLDPAVDGRFAVGVLLAPADAQRRHAHERQGEALRTTRS